MTNRFLISVAAAALIAGTGFANAQGAGTSREAPSTGSTMQQGGAASGTMNHDSGAAGTKGAESSGPKGSESGMKASESEKAPGATTKSAQDNMQGQKSKSMSSENETKGGKDMKADQKGTTNAQGTNVQGREGQTGNMNAQTKGAADSKSQTTGNAATSANAAPPAEKRTQIVSAIKSEKIQETTNVNFNVSVGTVVPSSVRFHPLPPRIVEIYPEWRGYDVVLVNGRYIILRPQTHEIVYIIEG